MKDDDNLPVSTPTTTAVLKKNATTSDHLRQICFGRGRYKVGLFGAMTLLAFWSMLTGTFSLRLSTNQLKHFSMQDSVDSPLPGNLDALEMDERVEFVKRMWDVYISENKRIRLGKFWQQAFEAAYEPLINDGVDVPEAAKARDEAISEIAILSVLLRIAYDPPPSVNSLRIQRL